MCSNRPSHATISAPTTAPAPENAIIWLYSLTSPWKIFRAKTGRNVSSGKPRNVVTKASDGERRCSAALVRT